MSQILSSLSVVGLNRDHFRISAVIHDKVQKYNGFTQRLKGFMGLEIIARYPISRQH